MAALRVLYLRDHMQAAGGSSYLLNTLPLFERTRVIPALCVLGPGEPGVNPGDTYPTHYIERPPRDPRRVLDLWHIIRASRPDLIVLSGPRSMMQGRLLARLAGIPTLLRLNFVYPESRLDGLVQRWLTSRRHRIWAVSKAVRRWASGYYRLPADTIHVIYPGHDWARYQASTAEARSDLRQSLAIASAARVILLVGRLKLAEKGQDVMLRAMPEILLRHPDVTLVLAGDGPDRTACEALVDELSLRPAVRFTGHRTDIPDLLAMTDLVAAPSTCEEAFGLVALEAQAAGRAVVVSGSGGLSELVEHERTGLIAGKSDHTALASALCRLLEDSTLAASVVRNGLRNAPTYGLDAHIERVTSLYETVVAEAT